MQLKGSVSVCEMCDVINTPMCRIILSATTPAMVFVVELLVLELVHHFCIARNLFPPNVYKPLVGHRVIELPCHLC